MPSSTEVVQAFNDAITARDLAALTALMTEDHRFVDGEGHTVEGRAACTEAWRGFFESFPDYRNVFEDVEEVSPGVVEVAGRSVCATPELHGPAHWHVEVRGDEVSLWQVR